MKIETHFTKGVAPDGTVESGGAVNVNGGIRMSHIDGGCGSKGCHCSDGHWISIIKPRTDEGIVEAVKMTFDDRAEMDHYLIEKE